MEKNDLINESGKGSFKIEEAKEKENNLNEVGAPPLVIVVQGGKNVLSLYLNYNCLFK
jgi:hypothetical protein